MDQAKRKRLEAKGWKFGSAADFLGLSYEDSVYVELRLRLSDALKIRRQAAKMSQKAFAAAVGSSQSRVAKMEANDPTVALDLLIRSLIALGVSLGELGRIMGFEERPALAVQATATLRQSVIPGSPYLLLHAAENSPERTRRR
ncbi:MAG TPA: helix-turn-helix transcriptional regulator [Pyrinomonadaceae bacterium]